jgi:hypothetical protein
MARATPPSREPPHTCEFCGSWRALATPTRKTGVVVVCKNPGAGRKWMVQTGPGESCGSWHPRGTPAAAAAPDEAEADA